MNNVRFELQTRDHRPALVCDDVRDLDISGFKADISTEADCLIRTRRCESYFMQNCRIVGDDGATQPVMSSF